MNYVTLNNGIEMPIVGFGTWQTPDGDVAYESVKAALEAGYTHIDTAAIYGNEESVGKAIADSNIDRESLFITTKLWNNARGYQNTLDAFEVSLKKLGLDYVDLYLIHWPNPLEHRQDWEFQNAESWRAMETLYKQGKVRAIGVSNFGSHHLDALFKTAVTKPAVNQIFLNPSDPQDALVAYNREHDIVIEAYSPLGTGKIFGNETVLEIANNLDKTVAQVVLRWSLQKGFVPLPKSVTPSRIQENIDIFDFELSKDDMNKLDALHGIFGHALNPDTVDF